METLIPNKECMNTVLLQAKVQESDVPYIERFLRGIATEVSFGEETDFFEELTEEDIQKIEKGREQIQQGVSISSQDLQKNPAFQGGASVNNSNNARKFQISLLQKAIYEANNETLYNGLQDQYFELTGQYFDRSTYKSKQEFNANNWSEVIIPNCTIVQVSEQKFQSQKNRNIYYRNLTILVWDDSKKVEKRVYPVKFFVTKRSGEVIPEPQLGEIVSVRLQYLESDPKITNYTAFRGSLATLV